MPGAGIYSAVSGPSPKSTEEQLSELRTENAELRRRVEALEKEADIEHRAKVLRGPDAA